MPIARFQMPDGRIGRFEVPEGTTPEQAQSMIAAQEPSQGMVMNPAVMAGHAVTRLGGLSKEPFSAPNFEKLGYDLGGKATDLAASAGLPPEIAGGIGYAANVASQAAPTWIGGLIGSAAGNVPKAGGEWLMRSALKPSTTLAPSESAAAVNTMLNAKAGNLLPGANVTEGGIQSLQGRVADLGGQVQNALSQAPGTVNKYALAKNAMKDVEGRFGPARNFTPTGDLNSIRSTIVDFLRTHPTEMTAKEAHDLKQGAYQLLGDKSYTGELKSAETEAGKALAKAVRGATEKLAPEIGPLNAEQGNLLNAIKAAISRNAVAGNKNPAGLTFLAENPVSALGFMADRSELIKSLLARLLYHGGPPATTAAGAAAGAALANQGEQ